MEALMEALGRRADMANIILIGTLMVMRIVPVTFITPFLGGKLVPPETRMGLAIGLTVFSFPYALSWTTGPLDFNPAIYLVLMLKELFIGYTLGFVATELFYAMEVAGRALDVMRGSNMAEVQVPELGFRASPLGDYTFQLLLIVFLGINGPIIFIEALVESFQVVPIDAWPAMSHGGFEQLTDAILKYTSKLFGIAFALVFPGLFATFMLDIVFGMLNRVSPQLNAYQMAMGIKALAGIAMFLVALSLMLKVLIEHAGGALKFVEEVIILFG